MYRVNPIHPCQAQQKAEVLSLDASASVRSEYRVEIRVFGRFRVAFKGVLGRQGLSLGFLARLRFLCYLGSWLQGLGLNEGCV